MEERLICKFDRIGRTHTVRDLAVVAGDADRIAEDVFKYARNFLASSDVEVLVNLHEMKGTIYAGFHVGGSFVMAPSQPVVCPECLELDCEHQLGPVLA